MPVQTLITEKLSPWKVHGARWNFLWNSSIKFYTIRVSDVVNKFINKGSFTYYVITKGEGGFRNDYAYVIFTLSNAEFDYGRGEGV